MAENEKNLPLEEEMEEDTVITLTDEETGEEKDFELIARGEIDGRLYFALVPADDEESEEYIILKAREDGDDIIFESVDDDDEFEKAEEFFNDLFFNEINYDEQ